MPATAGPAGPQAPQPSARCAAWLIGVTGALPGIPAGTLA
jgi:hypothetical protein